MAIFPKPFTNIENERYLNLIIILIPLMNFLSGISIDLYAPSMPAIAVYFNTSALAVKNTITALILGFGLGSVIFGVLFDAIGRREVILSSLALFIITSLVAPFCHSITQLLIVRFMQGLAVSVVSIGSRTLVVDHFSGHRYLVAMLYTSLAYGSGPVIGPFIGGYLQYHFGWQANFYAYAFFALAIFIMFLVYIHESLPQTKRVPIIHAIGSYKTIVSNPLFIICATVNGAVWVEQLLYPLVGPFLVQTQLGYSPITYGNSALLAGLSYVLGTLSNRLLLKSMTAKQSVALGLALSLLALVIQLVFALTIGLNLWTLVLPVVIMGFSTGFIFPNILSLCMRIFPHNAGVAAAAQTCLLMLATAIGTTVISVINIHRLIDLFWLYLILIVLQCIAFTTYLKNRFAV